MEWEKKITDNKFSKNTKSYCIYGSVEVFFTLQPGRVHPLSCFKRLQSKESQESIHSSSGKYYKFYLSLVSRTGVFFYTGK